MLRGIILHRSEREIVKDQCRACRHWDWAKGCILTYKIGSNLNAVDPQPRVACIQFNRPILEDMTEKEKRSLRVISFRRYGRIE